jgi:hypothetical protein
MLRSSNFLSGNVIDEVLGLVDLLFKTMKRRKPLDRQVCASEEIETGYNLSDHHTNEGFFGPTKLIGLSCGQFLLSGSAVWKGRGREA